MSKLSVNEITDEAGTGSPNFANGVQTSNINGGQVGGRRNLIINGDMRVAQRGTSFTADNVYTLDRWKSGDGTGGSPARTTTQETFALGQTDVPGFHHYLRHDQTGASTDSNSSLSTRIEDVTQFDGTTITVSFYAKADSTMTAQLRLIQNFGSGGSPSSLVEVNENISIGTSWQRYTVTKTLGSLSGKTLGTDGVHTSYLLVNFDFKTSTTFTFDITGVQLEVGDTATEFEHRSYGEELALCQRYYENVVIGNEGMTFSINKFGSCSHNRIYFKTTKRVIPSVNSPINQLTSFGVYNVSTDSTTVNMEFTPETTDTAAISIEKDGLTSSEAVAWVYNNIYDFPISLSADAEL